MNHCHRPVINVIGVIGLIGACRPRARRGIFAERFSGGRPGLGKCVFDVLDGGAAHFDAGVAPRLPMPPGIARPPLANAQPGDEADRAIHRDHLAVIAADPAERTVEARRIVAAHIDTAGAQPVPERVRGLSKSSHPVVQQAHAAHLRAPSRRAHRRTGVPGRPRG